MVPRQGEEATPSDAERADDAAGVTQYETRYSALSGAEISRAGVRCVFRTKSDTRFGGCRTPVSEHVGHPFRSMSDTG